MTLQPAQGGQRFAPGRATTPIDAAAKQAAEIYIGCKLSGLNDDEKGEFAEYLSYESDDVVLYVIWTARRLSENPGTRRWVEVSVRSGIDGAGPTFEASVRELLSAAYLRPLRDAEREMSPGHGSRLSQILASVPEIGQGEVFGTITNSHRIPPPLPSSVWSASRTTCATTLKSMLV